jgi:hypothetical protein
VKGASKVTDAQRRKIAAGKVAGRPHRRIAAEAGLAVTTVDHQVGDPRTVTLILGLKNRDARRLERMWKKMLDTLERDLKSKDVGVCAMARGQFLRLLPLGDPPLLRIAPADNSDGDFTLEELLQSYRRVTVRD